MKLWFIEGQSVFTKHMFEIFPKFFEWMNIENMNDREVSNVLKEKFVEQWQESEKKTMKYRWVGWILGKPEYMNTLKKAFPKYDEFMKVNEYLEENGFEYTDRHFKNIMIGNDGSVYLIDYGDSNVSDIWEKNYQKALEVNYSK